MSSSRRRTYRSPAYIPDEPVVRHILVVSGGLNETRHMVGSFFSCRLVCIMAVCVAGCLDCRRAGLACHSSTGVLGYRALSCDALGLRADFIEPVWSDSPMGLCRFSAGPTAERAKVRLDTRHVVDNDCDALSLSLRSRLSNANPPHHAHSPDRLRCKNRRTAGSLARPIARSYAVNASALAPARASRSARAAQ